MTSFDQALADRLYNRDVVSKFLDAAGNLAVNLVVAALIFVATLWLARVASNVTRRLLARVNRDGPPDATLQSFGGSLARYVVMIVGLIAVLSKLGVQTTSIIAVLGAASIAIGLALQGALSNVAAGVMLLLFRPYRVGDHVEVAGRRGRVEALDLFVTELSTPDNVKIVAPNGKIFGDVISNFSYHDRRRVDVVFKVDLKRDLTAVLEGLKARATSDPRVLAEPGPAVEVLSVSEAFVEAAVRAWVERPDYVDVRSDLTLAARLLAERPDAVLPPPPPSKAAAQKTAPARKARGLRLSAPKLRKKPSSSA